MLPDCDAIAISIADTAPDITTGKTPPSTPRNFILESIPHIGRLLTDSLAQILRWADHLVLAQKQNVDTLEQIRSSGTPVMALINGSLSSTLPQPAASRAGI